MIRAAGVRKKGSASSIVMFDSSPHAVEQPRCLRTIHMFPTVPYYTVNSDVNWAIGITCGVAMGPAVGSSDDYQLFSTRRGNSSCVLEWPIY